MSASNQGEPKKKRGIGGCGRIVMVLIIGALLGGGGWWWVSGVYLRSGALSMKQMEMREMGALQTVLAKLDEMTAGSEKHLSVALSARVLNQVLESLEGLQVAVPAEGGGTEVQLKLGKAVTKFREGYPSVQVPLQLTVEGGHVENLSATAVLEPMLVDGRFRARVTIVTLDAESLGGLPVAVQLLASRIACEEINKKLPTLDLPLQQAVRLPAVQAQRYDFPAKVNTGCTVNLQLSAPQLPEVTRWLVPKLAVFEERGMTLFAVLTDVAPSPEVKWVEEPTSQTAGQTSLDGLRSRLRQNMEAGQAAWSRLGDGEDFGVKVPLAVLEKLVAEANKWPDLQRTVTVKSAGSSGDLHAKTGGLPFGNGFKVYLERADSASAQAVAARLRLEGAEGSVSLRGSVEYQAKVQLHVHGNAPHIRPKVFGLNLGGGVKLGGGAGTSVGVSMRSPQTAEVSLRLAPKLKEGRYVFELLLDQPGNLSLNLDAGGVPEYVERGFLTGIQVPLPVGTPLYTVPLPPLISNEVPHPVAGHPPIQVEVTPAPPVIGSGWLELRGGVKLKTP